MEKLLILLLILCNLKYSEGISSCLQFSSRTIDLKEPVTGVFHNLPDVRGTITFSKTKSSTGIFYNSLTRSLSTKEKINRSTKLASFACEDGSRKPFILTFIIHDSNLQQPTWMYGTEIVDQTTIEVPEGMGSLASTIPGPRSQRLWCNGNDSPEVTKIQFSLPDGPNSDQFKIVSPKWNNTLALKLTSPLDYEKTQMVKLVVRCTDSDETGKEIGIANLQLNIRVTNLYELQFQHGQNPVDEVSVLEDEKPFTVIRNISVYYRSSAQRNLTFLVLTPSDVFGFEKCDLVHRRCGLVFKRRLDFEKPKDRLWHVKYRVFDHLTIPIEGDVRVKVINVDDNPLKFTDKTYVFETVSRTSRFVGRVEAVDKDGATDIIYSISSGNSSDRYFSIKEKTGEIYFRVDPKDMKSDLLYLTVWANSSNDADNALVTIELKAIEDSAAENRGTLTWTVAIISVVLLAQGY